MFSRKQNGLYYINTFDGNLNSCLTINLGSTDLIWLSANESNIFCLSNNSSILTFDWNGIRLVNCLNTGIIDAFPRNVVQIEIYENMFVLKCENKILILNKDNGNLVKNIETPDPMSEKFLIDSVSSRILIIENASRYVLNYSFELDLVTKIMLIDFPSNLDVFLDKNQNILFIDYKNLNIYLEII